jgi:hypothetical protein
MLRSWIDVLGVNCMIWISVQLRFRIWQIWLLDESTSLGLFSIECSMECIFCILCTLALYGYGLSMDIWFFVHIRQTSKDFHVLGCTHYDSQLSIMRRISSSNDTTETSSFLFHHLVNPCSNYQLATFRGNIAVKDRRDFPSTTMRFLPNTST